MVTGPHLLQPVLGRPTELQFLPDLARYLFNVARDTTPEKNIAAFSDASAAITIDVVSSNEERVGLLIAVADDIDAGMQDPYTMDFESSRAALAHTAYLAADLAGGIDLADFETLR